MRTQEKLATKEILRILNEDFADEPIFPKWMNYIDESDIDDTEFRFNFIVAKRAMRLMKELFLDAAMN